MTRPGDAPQMGRTVPPPFTPAEMHRRREALDQVMRDAEVEHAVAYGANRSGSAVQWLTGWPVTREAVVVHSIAAADVLLVQFYNHVPQARRVATDAEVRWAGPKTITTAVDELVARGVRATSRVGVVGALPFQAYESLRGSAGSVVDLTPAYYRLRQQKSAEELACLRRAAELTDLSCAALRDGAAVGTTEYELGALVEGSYVRLGGTNYIHYFSITSMDRPQQSVPAQWPSDRRLAAGDVVCCELSTSYGVDYPGQLLRTFTVAAEPTPLYAELHAVADEALHRVESVLAPGVTPAEVVAAAGVIEDAGFTTVDDLVHGLGGGYLAPVFGSRSRTLAPLSPVSFAAGMTVVVQPNVTTSDGLAGVQTGELLHVTADGCERLHSFPRGLGRIG
ncbi:MAG: M24 family metallopeptidase [Propionibacteriales bacterium]|nr:M24 family metallopeptidase [Propionibacteriales bacterium]